MSSVVCKRGDASGTGYVGRDGVLDLFGNDNLVPVVEEAVVLASEAMEAADAKDPSLRWMLQRHAPAGCRMLITYECGVGLTDEP